MISFSVSEKHIRYKVLLYSDNPEMIKILERELNNENVELVAKTIKVGKVFKTKEGNVEEKYLKIIYDLSLTDIDYKKVISEANKLSNNLIIILKGQDLDPTKNQGKGNKIILIDKPTKPTLEKAADFITINLIDNKKETISFTATKYKKNKINKIFFSILLFLLILFAPFLANGYLIINTFIFELLQSDKLNTKTNERIIISDVNLKKNIYTFNNYYAVLPIIGPAYEKASNYSERLYKESLYRLRIISKIKNFNLSMNKLLSGGYIKIRGKDDSTLSEKLVESGLFISKNKHSALTNAEEEMLGLLNLYNALADYSQSKDIKYFLIILQNDKVLTPTGGVPEEIYIYSVANGKYELVNSTTNKQLQSAFKGKIGNTNIFQNIGSFNSQDLVLNIKDKFKIFSAMTRDIYNLEISGLVTVEGKEMEYINEIKNAVADRTLSLEESVGLYQKMNKIIENNNINFYFVKNDGSVVENDSLNESSNNDKIKCFNNEFSVSEIYGDPYVFKSGGLKIKGEYKGGSLIITVYYSNPNTNGNYSLLINSFDGLKNIMSATKDVGWQRISVDNEEYLAMSFIGGINNRMIAQYMIGQGVCDEGVGFLMKKQPGNDHLKLEYEMESTVPFYLYIDHSLTGGGDKFYNNGLLYINKNILFEFAI